MKVKRIIITIRSPVKKVKLAALKATTRSPTLLQKLPASPSVSHRLQHFTTHSYGSALSVEYDSQLQNSSHNAYTK